MNWVLVGTLFVVALVACCMGFKRFALGAAIEAVADQQKSAQKARRPDMVATEGLFSVVRCPNYLGEMLFWTGVLLVGVTILSSVGQWAMALIGFVCIIFIMLDGARRMAKGHEARYAENPEYRAYAERTKLIIPFVW